MPEPLKIIINPPDLFERMEKYPLILKSHLRTTMRNSMYVVHSSVPSYPAPPASSTYRRTGTLGRSLIIGNMGAGNILEIKDTGIGIEGRFGTRLHYAQYVIGETTQAWMHRGRWWTMADLRQRAEPKVQKLFNRMGEALVKWLASK